MTLHCVKLILRGKTFQDKVSTEGCEDVVDLKSAIKSKFSRALDSYQPVQLSLFQPNGTARIDEQTPVTELKEIPKDPMVVTVEELPRPGSSKKQTFKGISTEESCRRFLNALAMEIYFVYEFPRPFSPTMSDVLAAKDGVCGKPVKVS